MRRRKLLHDGTFGPLEDVFGGPTPEEEVSSIGQELAIEKIKNMQKEALINSLGQQVAQLKIELLLMKGGA